MYALINYIFINECICMVYMYNSKICMCRYVKPNYNNNKPNWQFSLLQGEELSQQYLTNRPAKSKQYFYFNIAGGLNNYGANLPKIIWWWWQVTECRADDNENRRRTCMIPTYCAETDEDTNSLIFSNYKKKTVSSEF